VLGHWWEQVLHNQSALRLKARLLQQRGVVVASVPYQLRSAVEKTPGGPWRLAARPPRAAARRGGSQKADGRTQPVPVETAPKIKTTALHRLTAEREALHAEELQTEIVEISAKPIGDCGDREVVDVAGILRTVTLRPRGPSLTMEADLWDGTGNVTLVWLGRRDIKGIRPGRRIVVRGRVARIRGERTIYNPQYELQPSAVDASAPEAAIADLPSPG